MKSPSGYQAFAPLRPGFIDFYPPHRFRFIGPVQQLSPLRARPTRETLRGIYRGPGDMPRGTKTGRCL